MYLHFVNVLDRAAVDFVTISPEHVVDRGDNLARKDVRQWTSGKQDGASCDGQEIPTELDFSA
jgi:hypothetical protein